jgi:hypothetical protein
MTIGTGSPRETTSPGLRIGALLAMAGVAVWLMLSAYQTPAARECTSLYRAAKTPAERSRVAARVPDLPGNHGPEAHSCGFFSSSARWGL